MARLHPCVLLTAAFLLPAMPLQAQEETQLLDVVTVTARYRTESIQNVGAAITAVSGAELVNRGIANLDALAKSTVGISNIRLRQNNNELSIRGISNMGVSIFTSSNVFTVYVDDVSVASNFGQRDFGVVDLDRVELIRGPQPTLFGEGSVGGVIRYFTRDPDLDGPSFTGNVGGRFETIEGGGVGYLADAAASMILSSGKLGLRVSGYYTDDEGYIDNRLSGRNDVNDADSFGGRVVLLAQPNDRLSLRLSAFAARDEHGVDSQIEPGTDPRDLTLGIQGFPDGAFPDFSALGSDDINVYSGIVSYDAGPVEITSITGYYDRERRVDALNIGNTVLLQPFFPTITTTAYGVDTFTEETFSQEFRLVSDLDGPLNFIAGAYYRDRDIGRVSSLVLPELPEVSTPPSDIGQQNITDSESSQYSAFAEVTWSATDRLRLIGGVRYLEDTFESTFEETIGNLNPATAPYTPENPIDFLHVAEVLAFFGVAPPYEFELKEWLPRGGIEFDVNDAIMIYANVARGMRNGGVGQPLAALASAGDPGDPAFPETFIDNLFFDKDEVLSIDGGIKAVWLDGSLITNIGLFHSTYEDAQIHVLVPTSNTVNGPDQVIRGIELETRHRWNENLTTFLNATFLDSEFRDDFSLSGEGIDIQKGNDAINAPDVAFSVGYDYSRPLNANWNFVSGGDFQYVGKRYSDASNFPSGELDPLEILNLRLGFESDRLTLTAYVRNAFNDVEAILSGASVLSAVRDENGVAIDSTVIAEQYVNAPRAFGVSFAVRF